MGQVPLPSRNCALCKAVAKHLWDWEVSAYPIKVELVYAAPKNISRNRRNCSACRRGATLRRIAESQHWIRTFGPSQRRRLFICLWNRDHCGQCSRGSDYLTDGAVFAVVRFGKFRWRLLIIVAISILRFDVTAGPAARMTAVKNLCARSNRSVCLPILKMVTIRTFRRNMNPVSN